MQRNDLAEKKKVFIDGIEIQGLVRVGELLLEKGTLEVPEFKKIRVIQNGVSKINPVEATYKIKRDSETLAFFRSWYFDDLVKEVEIIRTDASGSEFARTLLQAVESVKYNEPEFDGASPTFAQLQVIFLPYEVIPLDAS